jgi:hypothetical protein
VIAGLFAAQSIFAAQTVTKLRAFSVDGLVSDTTYKKMTEGLISLEDMKPPVPPMSKFFDPSFVPEAWK